MWTKWSMQPRDRAVAARTVSSLCLVAAIVTIAFGVLEPSAHHGLDLLATVIPPALFVVAAMLLRRLDVHDRGSVASTVAWAVVPFIAILLICALDLLTTDGSVAAQIFLCFPVLYAASQLKRAGALSVTVAAVVADMIVVFTILPVRAAAVDAAYMGATLISTAMLLISAGERQDALVSELQRRAAVDSLTGLVTRRVLDEAAHFALSGAASDHGTALVLLDVDHFKRVNDEYGHPAGDEVLVGLAQVLRHGARRDDIVSRMGGDEIALLLPGCSAADAYRRAEAIVQGIRAHRFGIADGQQLRVSVSAGIAHAPTHATSVTGLYVAADAALYEAKRAGRDQVGRVPSDQLAISEVFAW
ncbi:MAG: Diguanylate cyclase [Frankiales bacterium]|nr:Diguanylate cyclase [Frankiales bacterium]